jgi:hypothetical protein
VRTIQLVPCASPCSKDDQTNRMLCFASSDKLALRCQPETLNICMLVQVVVVLVVGSAGRDAAGEPSHNLPAPLVSSQDACRAVLHGARPILPFPIQAPTARAGKSTPTTMAASPASLRPWPRHRAPPFRADRARFRGRELLMVKRVVQEPPYLAMVRGT